MKNKILKLMIAFSLSSFVLTGCSEEKAISINVENNKEFNEQNVGKEVMVKIGSGLYYDSNTKIVYWWNGYCNNSNASTMPTPYLAPNGLPYKYNIEINTFEEIKGE